MDGFLKNNIFTNNLQFFLVKLLIFSFFKLEINFKVVDKL